MMTNEHCACQSGAPVVGCEDKTYCLIFSPINFSRYSDVWREFCSRYPFGLVALPVVQEATALLQSLGCGVRQIDEPPARWMHHCGKYNEIETIIVTPGAIYGRNGA